MKIKIAIVLLILVIGSVVAWKFLHKKEFLYAGTVEATEIDISPRISSVISSLSVKEGEEVKSGQTLLTLDSEEIKLDQELAEKDYKRGLDLYKNGTMTKEAFDKLQYKYNQMTLRLHWCAIQSPIDGTALDVYHEVGEYVTPAVKLVTLADLKEVWSLIYVPQPLLAKLQLGLKVQGLIPESKKWIDGEIVHMNDEAEFTPKNVQTREERTRLIYGIKIRFPNPDRILKPGMSIEVRLPDF